MSNDPIKVYDARWEVAEFGDAEVRRLFEATYAYGRLLGVDTVVLTRDARLGAGRVMELGIEVGVRMGMRVFANPAMVSTPQGYFSTLWITQQYPKTMGLGITASHNPKQYVGIKFTVPVVQAIGQDCGPMNGLTRIREIYHSSEKFGPTAGGSLSLIELGREYVEYSMKSAGVKVGDLHGLRVVLDCFHGSAGAEIMMALTKAGVGVLPMRLIPDGNFPTGSPNPTSQGKMEAAVRLAGETDSDAVFGVDGDGDRIVFGDRRGILTAGFAFVPILQGSGFGVPGSRSTEPVLYDPKVSPMALAEWGKMGATPVLFRNGHSQIKDYMTKIGAVAAAEESGHYYHRLNLGDLTISGENSTLTILMFLAAMKQEPRLMDRLWEMQNQVFTTGEFNYEFASDAIRDQALNAVVAKLVGDGAGMVTTTPDGIDLQGTCLSKGVTLEPGRVSLAEGWYSGYLRIATNEKGVVRSYFSAGDVSSGKRVETLARNILEKEFAGRVID